ncbi:MAG: DNA repair protein RecO, partial [Oscillospiraceae bacterium]
MNESLKAIVINCVNYKESDKNITLLTAEKGIIFVKAKNAQKIKSKVSAYAEMFNYGKFNLYKNQTGYYLDSVEIEN